LLPQDRFPRFSDVLSRGEGVFPASATEPITRPVAQLKAVPADAGPERTPRPPVPNEPRDPGGRTLRIPLAGTLSPDVVRLDVQNGLVTIVARDAPLGEVLALLARQQGLNMIAGDDIRAKISITLTQVPIQSAITNILAIAGYTAVVQDGTLLITSIASDRKVSSAVQGRVVQVFRLDYTSATDVNGIIKGLLSPVGQSFVSQVKDADNRKTQEVLVVEDLPSNLERLAQTIQQLDVAPRQVLIEARILAVDLKDDMLSGVNFKILANADPAITIRTDQFADAAAYADPLKTQAFFFNLSSKNINQLVQALETTVNAKTLASPKVFVVNGQQAKIQIGDQLGYNLVTTTQTSTMQSCNFLNVGVILTVTPQITPDNQVLMKVKPEVSTGEINPKTLLPDSHTTQVETSVMLPDDHGIVIGGLIREEDTNNQSKIPFLGDLWLVGWLFQHRETHRSRQEVIISLIPHIVPYQPATDSREGREFLRSTTPLLQGPLKRYPRPWEPNLRDANQPPAIFGRWFGADGGTPYGDPGSAAQEGQPCPAEGPPQQQRLEIIASPPPEQSAQGPVRLPPVMTQTR
jgi:type IV pilus assembly protein PilQ